MANYIVKFIQGAKKHHGLDIDYVGIWNETNYDIGYIKMLKKTLAGQRPHDEDRRGGPLRESVENRR